jgi:methylmalonyl-CoA/ethylmalonyl-CoA epimerase
MDPDDFRFHHVGVVTRNLPGTIKLYRELGYRPSTTYSDPIQKADIVLCERNDGPIIEIISPIDADSPAMGWIKRIRAGPYHTCYEVDALEPAMATLARSDLLAVADPAPAVAFGMRRVVFLWGNKSGLFELLERAP